MDIAKSIFGGRDHEGYVGKDEHQVSHKEKLNLSNNMFYVD